MAEQSNIKPFPNFKVLDGYHCQTNSLAKIYDYHQAPLCEEMLLGLGAGFGFIYWSQKGTTPFLGGRDNMKSFYQDVGARTGVRIQPRTSTSPGKAEKELVALLRQNQPVMVYGDMAYLPCFNFGTEYHFGGHTFVICGYDGGDTVLVSEMEPQAAYLKKGFVYEMSLAQLAKARDSKFKPFPPQNAWLDFDFSGFCNPAPGDLRGAIAQVVERMLNPPIANIGVRGIRKAGVEVQKWPKLFSGDELRGNLFSIYIFIHIGGSGSGIFRYMYGRFLEEAATITGIEELKRAAEMVKECGDLWTEVALRFKDAMEVEDPVGLVKGAPEQLNIIAAKEEKVYEFLREVVK